MNIIDWVFKHLSGDPDEYCTPPGSELWRTFGDEIEGKLPKYTATTYNNDGFEIWIADYESDKWLCFFRAADARQLAKIILWDWWIVSTWFGLKRKIWYWSLTTKNKREGIGTR